MNQDKNTTKAVLLTVLAVIIGEGLLGWGLYWPFLFLLFDWEYVFWLALVVGILVASFNGLAIGLPSLFMVGALGLVSVFFTVKRGLGARLLLLAMMGNFLFDMVFGLPWGFWELVGVFVTAVFVFNWDSGGESIKVRYK